MYVIHHRKPKRCPMASQASDGVDAWDVFSVNIMQPTAALPSRTPYGHHKYCMYILDIPPCSPTLQTYHYLHQPHERTTICTNLMNVPPSTFNIHSVQLCTFNIHSIQLSTFNIHTIQQCIFKIHSVQLSTFNVHNVPPSNYRHRRFVPFAHIALSTALNAQF